MDLSVTQGNITAQAVDCIVVNLFEGVTSPGGATGVVDDALDGAISRLIASGDFTGAADSTALLYAHGAADNKPIAAARVLIVGLGPQDHFDARAARRAAAVAARELGKLNGVQSFATIVHGAGIAGMEAERAAQVLAEGTLLASYIAPQYKREPQTARLERGVVVEFDGDTIDAIRAGVERGQDMAHAATDPGEFDV